jgi:hypothetical protein
MNNIANLLFSFIRMLAFLVVTIFYHVLSFDLAGPRGTAGDRDGCPYGV